jgi:hypothetical protein
MKKYIYLTAAVLGLVFASSCGRKIEFEHIPFASLQTEVYSFNEDAGEITIPVTIYNPMNSDMQLTVKVTDGKAKEGVDFEILSPVSGVLTCAAGETSQNIVVGITNFPGKLTGSKDFSIEIGSATQGFQVGNCNTAQLTIMDLDHPLKDFIGVWTGSTTGYSGYNYTWDITVAGNDEDPTYSTLIVSNLCPYTSLYGGLSPAAGFNIFKATANSDMTQMIVENDQYIGTLDGEVLTLAGVDAPTLDTAQYYSDIVFHLSADKKTLTVPNAYGPVGSQGFWEIYPGPIVFAKK